MSNLVNQKWNTLAASKVVYFPLAHKGKDGEEKIRFMRVGIRVDMVDGSWWFLHFKRGSWSHHRPRVQSLTRWGTPAVEMMTETPILVAESKDSYPNFGAVVKEWGVRSPMLIDALLEGRDRALEDEQEKRAA